MSSIFRSIPGTGAESFKDPAATASALPTVGNQPGDLRVALDTFNIYVWDGANWQNKSGSGGTGILSLNGQTGNSQTFAVGTSGATLNVSSSGDVHTINIPNADTLGVTGGLVSKTQYDDLAANKFKVEKFTLSAGDITAKQVTLAATPTTPANTLLKVIGGSEQDYAVDFTVSGNTLSWDALVLDGVLEATDKIIVVYN